ncbi:MAG: HNH endonuclease, partial [Proteobacteria bacterium]
MLARHPDIESDIADGALTITALNSAYIFFKRETKAGHAFCFNRQGEILESLRQKSTREVERILLAHASSQDLHRKERCRQISETVVSLTITLDQVTLEKLESLKSLWSHKMPGANFSQLIAAMADSCLSARELRRPTICRPNRTPAPELEAASSFEFEHQFELDLRERDAATVDVSATGITTAGASESHKRSRHIPSAVRMTVWMRDGGKCGFVDAETGEVCSSRHRLEVDHVLPFASGGAHTVENLRLRCRTHNQWTASQMFGGRATKFRRSFVRELHVAYTA